MICPQIMASIVNAVMRDPNRPEVFRDCDHAEVRKVVYPLVKNFLQNQRKNHPTVKGNGRQKMDPSKPTVRLLFTPTVGTVQYDHVGNGQQTNSPRKHLVRKYCSFVLYMVL